MQSTAKLEKLLSKLGSRGQQGQQEAPCDNSSTWHLAHITAPTKLKVHLIILGVSSCFILQNLSTAFSCDKCSLAVMRVITLNALIDQGDWKYSEQLRTIEQLIELIE